MPAGGPLDAPPLLRLVLPQLLSVAPRLLVRLSLSLSLYLRAVVLVLRTGLLPVAGTLRMTLGLPPMLLLMLLLLFGAAIVLLGRLTERSGLLVLLPPGVVQARNVALRSDQIRTVLNFSRRYNSTRKVFSCFESRPTLRFRDHHS